MKSQRDFRDQPGIGAVVVVCQSAWMPASLSDLIFRVISEQGPEVPLTKIYATVWMTSSRNPYSGNGWMPDGDEAFQSQVRWKLWELVKRGCFVRIGRGCYSLAPN